MKLPIIMACGLPGTGKTSSTEYLEKRLEDFERYEVTGIRRELGFKRYSELQTTVVLRKMYENTIDSILEGKGVILEANYKSSRGRRIVYDIASSFNLDIILIEHTCSEKEAKRRIRRRPKKDELVNHPRDPRVYDKVKARWEETSSDLNTNPHISLIRYNTETNKFEDVKINDNVADLVFKIKEMLQEHSKDFQ